MRSELAMAIVLVAVVAAASSLQARTLVVNPDGTGDYSTIIAALNESVAGDTVLVTPGTYYETGLEVPGDVVLRGEQREQVTLDGSAGGRMVTLLATTAQVEGFTLMSCEDGAILAANGGIVLDCDFSPGCGVRVELRGSRIAGCTFSGGGIGFYSRFNLVEDCGFQGGGIWASDQSQASIRDCLFVDSSVVGSRINEFEFDRCRFVESEIRSDYGVTLIRECEFWNCPSVLTGLGNTIELHSCLVVGCDGPVFGGQGSRFELTGVLVRNSTIVGNRSETLASLHDGYIVFSFQHSILWGNCSAENNWVASGRWVKFECCVVEEREDAFTSPEEIDWIGVNHRVDPDFCEPVVCGEGPFDGGDFRLSAGSIALPENSGGCGQIGWGGLGCETTFIEPQTWSRTKALYR